MDVFSVWSFFQLHGFPNFYDELLKSSSKQEVYGGPKHFLASVVGIDIVIYRI